MSTAISFDPEAAANALLAEQSKRERVVRDLAASYGDILQRELELDTARTTHLQLRARASEFGITDAALKKAGIPNVGGGRTKKSPPRRTSRKNATETSYATAAPETSDQQSNGNVAVAS